MYLTLPEEVEAVGLHGGHPPAPAHQRAGASVHYPPSCKVPGVSPGPCS